MAESTLKEKTVYGMLWGGVQRFGSLVILFVSNIFLARFLSPEDFGSVGVLMIFIALSNAIIDGGLGAALIQKSNTTQVDYSTVFFWNIFLGVVLYGLLFLFAPSVSSYYHNDSITNILRVEGVILVTNSLGIIQNNQLRKNLKIKEIAVVNLIAVTISAITAVYLSYKGFGVWSIVVQYILSSSITTLLLWIVNKWTPSAVFSISSFKSLFKYGGFLLVSDLLNTLCDNIQGIIIGRNFSISTMGYYAQAKKMEEVPTQSISQVVAQVTFPVFSEIKNEKEKLQRAVEKCINLMNFVNIPLMIILIFVAEPLFLLLFSDKWLPSVPYFRILCVAGLVNCMQSVNYQLVTAAGKSKKMFNWNLIKRSAGIILILCGIPFGVKGILWGMVISFYLNFFVNAWLANKEIRYPVLRQIKDSLMIIGVAFLSALLSSLIVYYIDCHYVVSLLIQITLFAFFYLSISYFYKLEGVLFLRSFLKGKKIKDVINGYSD